MTDERTTTSSESTEPAEPDEAQLGDAGRRALDAERKARKDAERQLGDLGQRLEGLQRAEAERMAARDVLADGRDLWAEGSLQDVLDEEGNVDPGKVRGLVDTVAQSHPHYRKRGPVVTGGADGGRGGPAEPNVDDIAAKLIGGR